jgi:MoxR-like ATPase
VVIIADNSAGYGDETGAYAGVQPANAALVDRCGRLVIVDYLPPKLEAAALSQKTGLPFPAALRLAEFAKVVRVAAAKAGGEARPFSLRRLIAFAVATFRDKLTVEVACMATFLSRLPEADRETLRVAFGAHFKVDAYIAEMNGETVDEPATIAPPSQEPEQIEARRVF